MRRFTDTLGYVLPSSGRRTIITQVAADIMPTGHGNCMNSHGEKRKPAERTRLERAADSTRAASTRQPRWHEGATNESDAHVQTPR